MNNVNYTPLSKSGALKNKVVFYKKKWRSYKKVIFDKKKYSF